MSTGEQGWRLSKLLHSLPLLCSLPGPCGLGQPPATLVISWIYHVDTTIGNLNETAKRLGGHKRSSLRHTWIPAVFRIHKMIPFNEALSSSDHKAVNGLIVQNLEGFRSGRDVHNGTIAAFDCRRLRKATEPPSAAEPVYRAIFKCYLPNKSHTRYHVSHFDLFAQIKK